MKTNFGRDFGWFIELNDKVIAQLEPFKEINFTNSYVLEEVSNDYRHILTLNQDDWCELGLVYRNKGFTNYTRASGNYIGPSIF